MRTCTCVRKTRGSGQVDKEDRGRLCIYIQLQLLSSSASAVRHWLYLLRPHRLAIHILLLGVLAPLPLNVAFCQAFCLVVYLNNLFIWCDTLLFFSFIENIFGFFLMSSQFLSSCHWVEKCYLCVAQIGLQSFVSMSRLHYIQQNRNKTLFNEI